MTRQHGPISRRVVRHLGDIDDKINDLDKQVGADLGGHCGDPVELATDRPVRRCTTTTRRELLVENLSQSLLTPAHMSADLLPLPTDRQIARPGSR